MAYQAAAASALGSVQGTTTYTVRDQFIALRGPGNGQVFTVVGRIPRAVTVAQPKATTGLMWPNIRRGS